MRNRIAILVLLASFAWPAMLPGQEFRIYTAVSDQTVETDRLTGKHPVVSRSLTLFHAGKVYDFIPAANEVVIFEPAQNRFTILNTERNLATEVSVNEIERLLKIALGVAAAKKDPFLDFQLEPKFRNSFDRKSKRITLSSSYIHYESKSAEAPQAAAVDAYRRYADSVAKMNYVMHPRILLPGPRLALNEELAKRNALPLEVELQVNLREKIHLKAEHRIDWSLGANDRTRIQQWNSQLKNPATKHVPLRKYQELLRTR